MSSINEILLKHGLKYYQPMLFKHKSLIAKNLGNFAEPGTTSIATLDEGTAGAGVDHWSWSGWVATLVVLAIVIVLVIWFKKKVVE